MRVSALQNLEAVLHSEDTDCSCKAPKPELQTFPTFQPDCVLRFVKGSLC